MSYIEAIILGIIQGLTEFIPVSSSGHLLIMHHAMGLKDHALIFDVALHAGTLLALIGFFWRDIFELVKGLIFGGPKRRLALLIVLATLPAAVFGYLLQDMAESTFRAPRLVAATMIIFGAIMLVADYVYDRFKTHTSLGNISLKQAVAMGLAQAVALVPGVSRSGSTITTGLFFGLDRVAATRFSFLLGIPITVGATLKIFTAGETIRYVDGQFGVFAVGILAAAVSGVFAIRFMLRYLNKNGLAIFAYYRIGLGVAVLIGFGLY